MEKIDPMGDVNTGQCYRRDSELDITEMPDGHMLTNNKSGRVHYLNPVATIVFEMCDGAHSAAAIAEFLQRGFSLDNLPIDQVNSCLSTLTDQGLIKPCQ